MLKNMSKDKLQYGQENRSDAFQRQRREIPVERQAEPILAGINNLTTVQQPRNKAEMKRLRSMLERVTPTNPLLIYVGSCPDYATREGLYSYEGLGDNVPLLTKTHVINDMPLLKLLDAYQVPYEYIMMVADVEATDEFFCQKYTGGDEGIFLERLASSTQKTQTYLDATVQTEAYGHMRSSSFFGEFGKDKFMNLQNAYKTILEERYAVDTSFRYRIDDDTSRRMDMYKKMYGYTGQNYQEFFSFCAGRTIRTMAQYLTLGRLISESSDNAVMINHPTRNIGVPNERNKFPLAGDGPQPQPTIPIFEMAQKVYE